MQQAVKEYIQDNIEVIETNLYQFYNNLYTQQYNNGFVRKVTETLEQANIDTDYAREECLYDLFAEISYEAIASGAQDLHRWLDDEPNWFGYTIEEVINLLKHNSFNLGIQLIPNDDKIFNAPNYTVTEI